MTDGHLLNPDREIAFPPTSKYRPLPARGLLYAAGFDPKVVKAAGPRGEAERAPLLGSMTRLTVWPKTFAAGPVLGAPMAVMALEELIRRGAREIIFLGLAGGLGPELELGDLFCPDRALSTEGTSAHYPAPLTPDQTLRADLLAQAGDRPLKGGAVWSTDGFFRETVGLVAQQRRDGALAVEMEAAGLFAAANFRGIGLAALMVISDSLHGNEHHTAFHLPEFKAGLDRAADLAWKTLTGSD